MQQSTRNKRLENTAHQIPVAANNSQHEICHTYSLSYVLIHLSLSTCLIYALIYSLNIFHIYLIIYLKYGQLDVFVTWSYCIQCTVLLTSSCHHLTWLNIIHIPCCYTPFKVSVTIIGFYAQIEVTDIIPDWDALIKVNGMVALHDSWGGM